MDKLSKHLTLGFAAIAVFFLSMVVLSVAQHMWKTTCHGHCQHDLLCQKRCLERDYCPYGE